MRTLVPTSRRADVRNSRGFTLIELVVVMAVIAAVTTAVVIGVGNIRGASVQSEAGQLAVAVRYMYNLSVLKGKVHRLVIDLNDGRYWGEVQNSRDPCKMYLSPEEGEDQQDKSAGTDEDSDQPAKASFDRSKNRLIKKRKLTKGIVFGGVMTSHQRDISTSGTASVTFFPNGTAESAMIYIQDKDDEEDVMTVQVLALQGAARIHLNRLSTDEFFESE